jgi:REase_DpnII-MboI
MLLRGAPPTGITAAPPSIVSENAIQWKRVTLLQACMEQLQDQGMKATVEAGDEVSQRDAVSMFRLICRRFHAVAAQLQSQRHSRLTLVISDEYDVQDLLNALLQLHFDDVRPQEPTPSFGGGASRTDFLLKNEQIVVEAKMTRPTLTDKEVSFELMQDAAHYKRYSDCKNLVCLVYDPQGLIENPHRIENDIRKFSSEALGVELIVVPER